MKSAKECVTTHLPNQLAPKTDCAEASDRDSTTTACYAVVSRGAWGFAEKSWMRVRMKQPLVQILVVVANIQMRTLKAEVGKGSM